MDIIDKLIRATEQGKIDWENESEDIFVDNFYTTINNIRINLHVDYNDYVDTNGDIEEEYYLTIKPSSTGYIYNPKEQLKKLYTVVLNSINNDNDLKLLDDNLNQLLNN